MHHTPQSRKWKCSRIMVFRGTTFCVDLSLHVARSCLNTLHQDGIHQKHFQPCLLRTLTIRMLRMTNLWLWLILMKLNLIGSIVLYGYYMNLPGAFPLQFTRLNWPDVIQSLQWRGSEWMCIHGIKKLLIRYAITHIGTYVSRQTMKMKFSNICQV